MFRTIKFFTGFGLNLLTTVHTSYKYKQLEKKGLVEEQEAFLRAGVIRWARYLVESTKSEIEVHGRDHIPEGACLIISNHQSNFDIPILAGYIDKPMGFVAKQELGKVPIISKWMERIHCVFLDRENPRQAIKALAQAADTLKAGHSMVIFPEGTRSRSRVMGEFKTGSLRLADKGGVPVLPVSIINSSDIYEANNSRIQSAKVKVIINEPIYLDQLDKEGKEKLLDNIKSQIQADIDNYYKEANHGQ